jgi:hypothetical protein
MNGGAEQSRLIASPEVRPWALGRLLVAVRAAPAGQKLSIPALRDALVNQADVLDGLQALIRDGKLDPATLRPPGTLPPTLPLPSEEDSARSREATRAVGTGRHATDEPSAPLVAALVAEGERRGLSRRATSIAVFALKCRLDAISAHAMVRKATADKIRAWIADKPVEAPAKRESAVILPPPPTPEPAIVHLPPGPGLEPSPCELLRAIEAFLAGSGISATAFGKAVNGDAALVKGIRDGRSPRRKTIAKIRALIADPPASLLNVRYRASRRAAAAAAPRDPTQKPDTPLMDARERYETANRRRTAGVNRAVGREAERRLNGEEIGRKVTPAVRGAMQMIQDREAAEHRQTDPVERAKLALQRKGRVVHSALIHGGRKDRFMVGGQRDPRTGRLKELTPAELIALAEKVTGQTFRRVA